MLVVPVNCLPEDGETIKETWGGYKPWKNIFQSFPALVKNVCSSSSPKGAAPHIIYFKYFK